MGGVTMPALAEDVDGPDEEMLLARAYLSRVAEPGNVALWLFVEEVGPLEAARRVRSGEVSDSVRSATVARRDVADPPGDLEVAQRHGIRLLVPESRDWPHYALAALAHRAVRPGRTDEDPDAPPLALWVKGCSDPSSLGARSVAIVGARAATDYGESVSAELGYGLAAEGIEVISGGAYGIDAAAHRGALAASGATVLVSAGGLDRPYPPGNAALYVRVAEAGLVVSESPPGCAPQRHRFLTRNRLIAAFGAGTVVVEAARRSGAANTARQARALGRPVMAVPGPVTSPMSAGCHDLLRRDVDPALLVTSVSDVLDVLGRGGLGRPPPGREPLPMSVGDARAAAAADPRTQIDELDPTARSVLDGMPARRAVGPDDIAVRSGLAVIEVLRALPMLEIRGLVEVSDAGYRLGAALRPPARNRARQTDA
jgi:DNA processing protein